MIGGIDVKVQAHNPNFPLEPVFTFINSAQSFRIRNVPRAIGKWNITKVFIHLNYPDETTISKECVLNGNIWIGTVEGCATSGTSTNGFYVTASGIDENENVITNYVLGAGDLYVKDLDGTIDPERVGTKMYFNDTLPENPKKGDATFIDGVLNVYDGTNWTPVANDPDLSNYYTKTEVDEAIGEVEDSIPTKTSDLTNDSGFITSANVPTKTSDLTNDSGFITSADVPTKTSDLVNDSGFITSTELENGVEKLVEDANDEHSTRVVVDEYDNVLVQKYTTGWYVSKIEVAVGTSTDYTETNEYYAYLTDVRLDTEAGRLYYATVAQDKQRNLSPYKRSDFTQNYSTGEFIAFSSWTATQAGGQSIQLHLTITNAETPVWVNIARLVPDSAKRSGLLDTQITPYGQFLTPTQVKPYSGILGYASRAQGSLFMFGRTGMLTPDENHFVTIDFNVGKLCYVGQTQYPWQLSMYNGTTFDPPIQMNYGYWGTVGIKVNGRLRNFAINRDCWLGIITVDSRNTRPCYIMGIENENGSIVADNNFYYYGASYPITFSANNLSIETIDGVEGGITCTRQGTGTHQTEFKYFAYEDSVPTKTSDLTNDSGFITVTALTPYREKSDLYYEHSFSKTNWQNVPRFIMDYDGTQTIFDKFDSTLNRWNVSTGTSDWYVQESLTGMEADPQFTLTKLESGISDILPTEGAGTTTVSFIDMGIEGTFTMDMSDQLVCKVYVDRQISALEARIAALENNNQ